MKYSRCFYLNWHVLNCKNSKYLNFNFLDLYLQKVSNSRGLCVFIYTSTHYLYLIRKRQVKYKLNDVSTKFRIHRNFDDKNMKY